MIQLFSYIVKTKGKEFEFSIYSPDLHSSVEKWINRLEDDQNEVFSFNEKEVANIKQQFLSNELNIQFDKEPYFLTYKVVDMIQVVTIENVKRTNPDFIAKLYYLTKGEGGRRNYVFTGFRPHIKFAGIDDSTSGEQLFIEKDKVVPGELAIAEIRLLRHQLFENYLYVGQQFEILEVQNIIGHGEIIEIVNSSLQRINSK